MNVVAVIPVRAGSQRVRDKNFRPFYGDKSLLETKVEQILADRCVDELYVSSDSNTARDIAAHCGVCFLRRDKEYSVHESIWSQVIAHIVERLPGDNPIVCWAQVTSPLFRRFAEAIGRFSELEAAGANDSLVAVSKRKEYLLNGRGRGLNYCFGHWHDQSQDLEAHYAVTGALFVARKRDILEWKYLIGRRPILFEVSKREELDVDEPEDFDIARELYAKQQP